MQSVSVFLDIAKFSDFRGVNADVNKTQGVCHMIYIFFDPLQARYCRVKYHHCRICVTHPREGRPFCPPIC